MPRCIWVLTCFRLSSLSKPKSPALSVKKLRAACSGLPRYVFSDYPENIDAGRPVCLFQRTRHSGPFCSLNCFHLAWRTVSGFIGSRLNGLAGGTARGWAACDDGWLISLTGASQDASPSSNNTGIKTSRFIGIPPFIIYIGGVY